MMLAQHAAGTLGQSQLNDMTKHYSGSIMTNCISGAMSQMTAQRSTGHQWLNYKLSNTQTESIRHQTSQHRLIASNTAHNIHYVSDFEETQDQKCLHKLKWTGPYYRQYFCKLPQTHQHVFNFPFSSSIFYLQIILSSNLSHTYSVVSHFQMEVI